MGFGTIFIGYVLLFNLIPGYTDVFACLLMALGLTKTIPFEERFRRPLYLVLLTILPAGASFLLEMLGLVGISLGGFYLESLYPLLRAILFLFITLDLLLAVDRIAEVTDIPALRVASFRNRIFTGLYYGLCIFSNLGFASDSILAKIALYAVFATILVGLFTHFLNAKLLFSCYMWICPEGEEGMEREQSRFAFVNRIREKTDEREEAFARRKSEEQNEKLRKRIEKRRRKK
jgi:hypothetical protein